MKQTGLSAECYAAVGTIWKYMRHGQAGQHIAAFDLLWMFPQRELLV